MPTQKKHIQRYRTLQFGQHYICICKERKFCELMHSLQKYFTISRLIVNWREKSYQRKKMFNSARTIWNKTKNIILFYFTRTQTTMSYFSFISHVRAALFFNTSKTIKQLWNAATICFGIETVRYRVLFQFYFTRVNNFFSNNQFDKTHSSKR